MLLQVNYLVRSQTLNGLLTMLLGDMPKYQYHQL